MAIYRHRADILPSLIVIAVFTLQLWAVFTLESTTALLAVAAGLLLFSACPGSISHNHHHTMTFRYRWMNRIYEVILFLETGVPPFAWTLHHNISDKYCGARSKQTAARRVLEIKRLHRYDSTSGKGR